MAIPAMAPLLRVLWDDVAAAAVVVTAAAVVVVMVVKLVELDLEVEDDAELDEVISAGMGWPG